jgi:uncharacterized protein YndB with AHSA1/START domain
MNSNLKMDFSLDKENNTINVKREFAAPLVNVWAAWTQSELLDQWWAPRPYVAVTKSMDFKEGGCWLYAMQGPEGDKHWCAVEYRSINAMQNFSAKSAFSDENGVVINELPHFVMNNSFAAANDVSTVSVVLQFDSLAAMEGIIQMGFKEGFTAGLDQLEELLANS